MLETGEVLRKFDWTSSTAFGNGDGHRYMDVRIIA